MLRNWQVFGVQGGIMPRGILRRVDAEHGGSGTRTNYNR
jgi:hypothetical protein